MDTKAPSEDRILAGLAHLGILLNWVGVVAVLVVYLLKRDDSPFVAGHAKQALGWQLASMIAAAALGLAAAGTFMGAMMIGMHGAGAMPMLGMGLAAFAFFALNVVFVVLAVIAAVRAFQGQRYAYPVIGGWVGRL